jgi:hypothetical protein
MREREGLPVAATPAEAGSALAFGPAQKAAPAVMVFVRGEVAVVLAVGVTAVVPTRHSKSRMVRGVYPRRRRDMN